MFGKPEWFKPKTFGWGIDPVTWQGWTWLGIWLAVMGIPYLAFVANAHPSWSKGFIWLGAMGGLLVYDVYQILKSMKSAGQPGPGTASPKSSPATVAAGKKPTQSDVLFIGDEPPTNIATKNYDFRVRQ